MENIYGISVKECVVSMIFNRRDVEWWHDIMIKVTAFTAKLKGFSVLCGVTNSAVSLVRLRNWISVKSIMSIRSIGSVLKQCVPNSLRLLYT